MRLLIISVAAFSMAALAMLITDSRAMRLRNIALYSKDHVKEVEFSTKNWTPEQTSQLVIIPVQQGRNKIMTGFPSYSSLKFHLPKFTKIDTGRLILDFALQIPENAGGSLRVLLNNEKRAEVLLSNDEENYRVIVDLDEDDLQKEVLNISLSADGYGANGECPDDRARISIIDIDQSSRIELNLGEEIKNPADALLLAGNPIRVLMPENATQQTREQLFVVLQKLMMQGVQTHLVNKNEVTNQISVRVNPEIGSPLYDAENFEIVIAGQKDLDLFRGVTRRLVKSANTLPLEQQRVTLNSLGVTSSPRQFQHSVKWRTDYSLKDMPNGAVPQEMSLNVISSLASDISDALLSVTQNNEIIYSHAFSSSDANKGMTLSVPLQRAWLNNSIDITLYTNENRAGICNPGREGIVQIAKTSHFAAFKAASEETEESLPSRLLKENTLQIHAPYTLKQSAYEKTLDLLNEIVPTQIELATSNQEVTTATAKIIPAEMIKSEISQYQLEISEDINQQSTQLETGDSDKIDTHYTKFWVATGAKNTRQQDTPSIFRPLTPALAEQILLSEQKQPMVILNVSDENTDGTHS